MKIIEKLPPRGILVLIILLSFINPLHYAIMSITTPNNKVFLGGHVDDFFQLTLMNSVEWNFNSPWDLDQTVFENPVLGASYTFVLLGTLPALLEINLIVAFLVIKFLLSIIYLVIIYNIVKYFLESEKDIKLGYLIFLFSAGIGSFIYLLFLLVAPNYSPVVGFALTAEFDELGGGAHALSHLTRIYWLLPEVTGLISLMLFMMKRRVIAGIFLGLTILFYPTFAIAFAFLILVYAIVEKHKSKLDLMDFVKMLFPVIFISAVFSFPWVISSLQSPQYFNQYRQWFSGYPFLTLIVSFFFTFVLSFYGFTKKTKSLLNKKIFALLLMLFSLLSTLAHLHEFAGGSLILTEWLKATGLFGISSFLNSLAVIDLPLIFLLGLLSYDILRKNLDKKYTFLILWITGITAITVVSAQFVFWWPARMRWFLLLPLSMASVHGIKYLANTKMPFFSKKKIKEIHIVLIIALLSLPSLLAFNFYIQQVAHSSDRVYISEEDFQALMFIKNQPDGRVLSGSDIGNVLPFVTGKTSLLFDDSKTERHFDVELFYSNSTKDEKYKILKKYGISYVFYGDHEKKFGITDLEGLDFLMKIYDNVTAVYRVAA